MAIRGLAPRNAIVLVIVAGALAPLPVRAEGETTPMIGASVIGGGENERGLVGAELETAWWYWRVGLAGRGSVLWTTDPDGRNGFLVGLTARLLVYDTLVESVLEPRDVELGIELHGILEHAWWSEQDPSNRFGFGVAVRLRGDSEYDGSLLAESRMFLRVMAEPRQPEPWIARSTTTMPHANEPVVGVMVMVGVGASWGRGDDGYLERFRLRAFSPAAQRLANQWFEGR
jgi:hypothetical protein